MMSFLRILFVTIIYLLMAPAVHANAIEWRGFGSFVAEKPSAPSYYLDEYSVEGRSLTFSPETRFGLNLSANPLPDWTVAAQVIATARSKDYTMLDWGFLSYQPMPELAIRAGRIRVPFWLYSQQIDVGYSYIWVRPPTEVYSLLSNIKSFNGLSVLGRLPIGPLNTSLEVFTGGTESISITQQNAINPAKYSVQLRNGLGAALDIDYQEMIHVHASYAQANADYRATGTLLTASAAGTDLAYVTQTAFDAHFAQFYSLGAKIDVHNIKLSSEVANRKISGTALSLATAWYATLGYQIHKLTPYFGYAAQPKIEGTAAFHPDYPKVTALETNEHSYVVGANYALKENIDLKAEFTKARQEYNDPGSSFNYTIASLAADFIF